VLHFSVSSASAALVLVEQLECERAVRDGRASPECCGQERDLGDLLAGRTRPLRIARVDVQTVGTLRRKRNSQRNQFAIFSRNLAVVFADDGIESDETFELVGASLFNSGKSFRSSPS